jgi:ribose transport system permease protein
VVTKLKVNSFIATLGTASIFAGVVQIYVGTEGLRLDDTSAQYLGQGQLLGLPVSIVILAVGLVLGQAVLSFTTFGRSVQSVGGNFEASRLAGLATSRIRTAAFMISGVTAAIAGAVFASRIGFIQSAQVNSESSLLLNAIAVVVVGGTSLMGGEGAVWRSAIGVAIFACLGNIFTALAIDPTTANLVKGSVLIAAVSIDVYSRRRRLGA